jgi:hypothetical protein
VAQVDPWKMVADCELTLQQVTDPRIRDVLTDMRDLWIGLANERQLRRPSRCEAEVETPGRVYGEWAGSKDEAAALS